MTYAMQCIMHGARSDQVATVMVTSLTCCRKENVHGRRSTRSAALAQNGRSDIAQSLREQYSTVRLASHFEREVH